MKTYQKHVCLFWIMTICGIIAGLNDQLRTRENAFPCQRTVMNSTMRFFCSLGSDMEDLRIYDLNDTELEIIDKLEVIGDGIRGPLRSIPINICRFKQLKYLDLSNNQISNGSFYFSFPCLPQLESLDLSKNFLSEIPTLWISQMPNLLSINLSQNNLSSIPANMFSNISHLSTLDVSSNRLTTFELWLIQIKDLIDYSNNRITQFTNHDNVDLSSYHSEITRQIFLNNTETIIDVDDGILEMYNRCGEINSTYTQLLMETVKRIHDIHPKLLNWNCSCQCYHLQKYVLPAEVDTALSTWECLSDDDMTLDQQCHCQSSFSGEHIEHRWCQIKDWEASQVSMCNKTDPDIAANCSNLGYFITAMYRKLIKMNVSNDVMVTRLVNQIYRFNKRLNELTIYQKMTESMRADLRNITIKIENLLESIRIPINITRDSIAVLSLWKNRSIYSYSQIERINSTLTYSIETSNDNLTTSISINRSPIDKLSAADIYTFYYLPSSLFRHAQKDQRLIIISPIVGLHVPNQSPRLITMSFTHTTNLFGAYFCAFWQAGEWNDTGCDYWQGVKPNRHFCRCNHTTSFALLFIPGRPIHEAYIPSIVIAFLSIVCFAVSIILSLRRRVTSFRHLSIANIFTLSNSIVLFTLLTVILIRGYQSWNIKAKPHERCSTSEQNLAIATYFFLIVTFASKTLLGVCYLLTIFFHFIFIRCTSLSHKWIYTSFVLVILMAMIPTIVIRIILDQWSDLFLQYQGICWFNSSVIFRFISIPILIFIGLNLLIIFAISIRLVQFFLGRKMAQTSEKRIIVSLMIWLSLCISLGIAWIVGPFLDVITTEKTQSSSIIIQWIFGFFIGFEGVWVLVINVAFYFNQKVNVKNTQMMFNKVNRSEF